MKKKILVTGANGFIGKEIVRQLSKIGYKIISFDLLFDKKPYNKNISQFKGSILNELELHKAMEGCEYVIHLAAALVA